MLKGVCRRSPPAPGWLVWMWPAGLGKAADDDHGMLRCAICCGFVGESCLTCPFSRTLHPTNLIRLGDLRNLYGADIGAQRPARPAESLEIRSSVPFAVPFLARCRGALTHCGVETAASPETAALRCSGRFGVTGSSVARGRTVTGMGQLGSGWRVRTQSAGAFLPSHLDRWPRDPWTQWEGSQEPCDRGPGQVLRVVQG
jgi:hypothetical protein